MATTSAIDVVMPQMGVSVSEGTITKWLKQEGEPVAADEALLEISTDKVDTEVPSPGEGVVQQILVQEGETVEVGTKLAVIAPEGAAAAPAPPAEEAPSEPATAQAASSADAPSSSKGEPAMPGALEAPPPPEPPAPAPEVPAPAPQAPAPPPPPEPPAQAPEAPTPPLEAPAPAAPETPSDGAGERTFVSPVVARIASEHGIDVDRVQGSGRGGRVTKKDILAFVESGSPAAPEAAAAPAPSREAPAPAAEPTPSAAPPPPPPPPAPAPSAPQPVAQAGQPQPGESFEPMNAMRRGIAEHMRRSLDTSAHVTSAIEVDMSMVVSIRKKLKQEYQASYGVNPTYLAFVARATVETLRDYPWINGELRGEQIVTRNYVNLGFAVELADGKGLIVPVLKNAEGLNLLGMARGIAEVAARARDKKLLPDDVQGGTFTITNPGGYGTFHGTPVISQPQAAILGTYAVVKRPWVVQDGRGEDVIAIRPIMNVTLTYDHRLVDGAMAGRFLRDLRERLQTSEESAY
jgi:pyruvate dehydrogenase E2 component (dihydrolipoamide acetyltransferase)